MKKWLLILFLAAGFGCFTKSALMTREGYAAVHLGAPASEVVAHVGKPYRVHDLGGGKEEYEYIERLSLGKNLIAENRYFIVLLQGRVIAKRYSQEKPPAYNIIYQDDPTLSY